MSSVIVTTVPSPCTTGPFCQLGGVNESVNCTVYVWFGSVSKEKWNLPPTLAEPKSVTVGVEPPQEMLHDVTNRLLTTTPVQTSLPVALTPLVRLGPQLV